MSTESFPTRDHHLPLGGAGVGKDGFHPGGAQ